jgi:predicted CopG family antitoxin
MNSKLTLSIDDEVISKAKKYARKSGRSLSDLIENYLKKITSSDKDDLNISPKVRNLMGSFKVPDDFDYKAELTKALHEKYSK